MRDMRNLTKAVGEQANGSFWAAESLLFGAENIVRQLGHPAKLSDSGKLKSEMEEMQRPHGLSHSNFIVSKDGHIVSVSGLNLPSSPINVADRLYFQIHRDRTEVATFIDDPFISRASGKWSITMTRGVYDNQHQFIGLVGAALRIPSFVDFYSNLDLGPNSSVALVRADGQILARYPFIQEAMTTKVTDLAKEMAKVKDGDIGMFKTVSPFHGGNRVLSFKRLEGYPVAAVISIPEDRILERWHLSFVWHIVLLCAGILTTLVAGALLWRQLIAIEQRTLQSLCDELTKLPNRRAFDEHLAQEARRAIRTGKPLCLLMMDLDKFKRYNDVNGHGAGDQCLCAVASALAEKINRPGDMVSRWGGEEFCCILPECDEAGAVSMANTMLNAVRDRNIPHPDAARVTISVGCVSMKLESLEVIESLKERADEALYEAKRLGRDRYAVSHASVENAA
ncbi:diguanylate cyclase [Comamonas sp. wu1-DMT]|uniref:diguanylate cyclase domain-containing protein n=1 Tax=Comamonas sp. wu1-DMT TaxID=3126390 RepID=UPI0032E4F4E9